jgi:hypothetical protein
VKTLSAFLAAMLLFVAPVLAQQHQSQVRAQAAPSPSASFCVNSNNGAMRLVLIDLGIAKPCRHNEIPLTFDQLQAIAAGSVSPGAPTPEPSPQPTASPWPSSGQFPYVEDANGKIIGPVMGTIDGKQAQLVLVNINGALIELEVSAEGFLNEDSSNGGYGSPFEELFTTPDCSGQAYISAGPTSDPMNDEGRPLPEATNPLIEVPSQTANISGAISGPYVKGGNIYYPVAPFQQFSAQSFRMYSFADDPAVPGETPACQPGNPQVWDVGVMAVTPLTSLGFQAPFKTVLK